VGSKIDIDSLNESELIDLNNRVIERLHFLQGRGESQKAWAIPDRGRLNDLLALTIEDSSAQGEQRFISIEVQR